MNTWKNGEGEFVNPKTCVVKCSKCGCLTTNGIMIPHTYKFLCVGCSDKYARAVIDK